MSMKIDEAHLSPEWVLLRDYLRAHPEGAQCYAAPKRDLADKFKNDPSATPKLRQVSFKKC